MTKADETPRGLPGGIAPPAVVCLISFVIFIVSFSNPGLIDLPYVSAAGLGVTLAAASFFWLLIAIAKRVPPEQ